MIIEAKDGTHSNDAAAFFLYEIRGASALTYTATYTATGDYSGRRGTTRLPTESCTTSPLWFLVVVLILINP
jgi:hypothetical protein